MNHSHLSTFSDVFNVVPTALCLALLLLTICWLWFQWQYRQIIAAVSKLPPIAPIWPILGHIPLILKGHHELSDYFIKCLKQAGDKQQKNFSIWWGPFPAIIIGVSEDIQTVTTSKKCEKRFFYDFIKCLFGNGLLTAPEAVHKFTRRHINPLFTPRNLSHLSPVTNASAHHLVHGLSGHVGHDHVNVEHMASSTSLKTICDLLLGPNNGIDEGSTLFKDLQTHIDSMLVLLMKRFTKPWLWPDVVFHTVYSNEIKKFHEVWRLFSEEPLKAIRDRNTLRDSLQNYNNEEVTNLREDADTPFLTLPDVYDELRQRHPEFSDQDMQYEFLTLLITGTHTSKVALSSFLLALAAYPHVQERLYQEVVSAVGAEDSDVIPEDFNRMPYLDQVFKETLRKFATVPFVGRTSTEDIKLRDMTVPAGTLMLMSLMSQNYDSEVFPDPHTFDPEHFAPENMAKIKKHSFSPFSLGPRNCIGNIYATTIFKTMAVHVIRKFRLSTSVDINSLKYSLSIDSYSTDGYHLELQPRDPDRM